MSEDRPATYLPILIGSLVGAVGGFCLLIFAFLTAFGICSDTFVAEALFPFALAADPTLHDYALVALLVALVQYPIYGVILGLAWLKDRVSKSWVIACALVLLVMHSLAVGAAKHRVNGMWEERFSRPHQLEGSR
jgi:hypothetical protein